MLSKGITVLETTDELFTSYKNFYPDGREEDIKTTLAVLLTNCTQYVIVDQQYLTEEEKGEIINDFIKKP